MPKRDASILVIQDNKSGLLCRILGWFRRFRETVSVLLNRTFVRLVSSLNSPSDRRALGICTPNSAEDFRKLVSLKPWMTALNDSPLSGEPQKMPPDK